MRNGLMNAAAAVATALVALGGAQAQTPASAATEKHSMEGTVTKVDAKKGWVDVKTPEGSMKLHFPPPALDGVKAGHRVTIELGMSASPGGAMPKTK